MRLEGKCLACGEGPGRVIPEGVGGVLHYSLQHCVQEVCLVLQRDEEVSVKMKERDFVSLLIWLSKSGVSEDLMSRV